MKSGLEIWWGTDIPNTHEKSTKNKRATEWYRWMVNHGGECGAINTNVECSCCYVVEVVEYFQLLYLRYGDMNGVTQRVACEIVHF